MNPRRKMLLPRHTSQGDVVKIISNAIKGNYKHNDHKTGDIARQDEKQQRGVIYEYTKKKEKENI